jgi:hypothetical protein
MAITFCHPKQCEVFQLLSLFFRDSFILRSDEKTLQVIARHEAICIIEFIFQKDLKYKTKIPRYLGMAITFCHPKQCEVFQLLSLFFRDCFILRSDKKTLQVIVRHEAISIIEFIFQKDLKYKTKIPRYLGMTITFCLPERSEGSNSRKIDSSLPRNDNYFPVILNAVKDL